MNQHGFDDERDDDGRGRDSSATPGGSGDGAGGDRPGEAGSGARGPAGGIPFGLGGFAGRFGAQRGPGQGPHAGGPRRPSGPGGPSGPRRPMPTGRPRRPSPLAITLLVLAVVIGLGGFASFAWTEVMWFDSVGYSSVFWTQVWAQVALFLVGFAVAFAVIASSLLIAYRKRPIYAPTTQAEQALDRYREMLDPVRKVGMVLIPAVLGLFAGLAASSQWKTLLLFVNGGDFGKVDPTFGMDVGFFVFRLPLFLFLESFLTMTLVLALLAAVVTHYVYGGLSVGAGGVHTSPAARVHLAVLGAAFVLVRAVGYWLDRYSLSVESAGRITGLQYTQDNAVLLTKGILAVAAVICALLFLSTLWTRSWRVPLIGLVSLVTVSLVVGSLYPAVIQSFRVKPSEQSLEAPYIQHNIDATRAAYGLDVIAKEPYLAKKTADRGGLSGDQETIPGIRVVDPMLVNPTFQQLQGLRRYYEFPDALDVDRYTIGGKKEDAVIAARELDLQNTPSRTWVNDHTVYTHGYGVVAAYGTRRDSRGEPVFFAKDIPMSGELGAFEPRIYFGERTTTYSIVGKPDGAGDSEIDYQSDQGEARTTFSGNGGVKMDNIFKRLAYATLYREYNILLSSQVGNYSTVLDHRTPSERVERVAPWLTLDGNPYPAVVDGRVQWILDGYTTSSNYPYSQLQSIESATRDTVTSTKNSVQEIRAGQVNYIRNSVKATVDAYDGSVRLYTWDEKDPVLKAWSQAFGNTVRPLSEISGQLMSHLRYPEDMFKVQRELLSRYHVTDASAWYSGGDYWKVPEDPTMGAAAKATQPPYYLSIAMPGQNQPAFSLTTSFTPAGENRQFMTGFLSVDADAGDQTGRRREGYGKMRLLELPSATNVMGPAQVQNQFDTSNQNSTDFSVTLSQFMNLNQGGSRVQKGNLLTLPVGGGLLYVQPIYVSGAVGTSYPLNQAIAVSFGEKLAWGATLESALNQLFGGESGAKTDQPPVPGDKKPGQPPAPSEPSADVKAALAEAQKAYTAGQEALKKGDFAAYGEAQKQLQSALERAAAASGKLPGSNPSPASPAPSGQAPSPSPSPTS